MCLLLVRKQVAEEGGIKGFFMYFGAKRDGL